MGKFGHFQQLEVEDRTSEYTIHQITVNGKSPTLIGRAAVAANKPYYNELLKRSFKYAKQLQAGKVTAEQLDENRDEDRALFPKHIFSAWTETTDSEGKEVVFSAEDCLDFLTALPDWIFDDVRAHFSNPNNFVENINITPAQVETKAKN